MDDSSSPHWPARVEELSQSQGGAGTTLACREIPPEGLGDALASQDAVTSVGAKAHTTLPLPGTWPQWVR